MDILWFLIVGLLAGWLGGMLVKGRSLGLMGDIVAGVLGAFMGGYLFGTLGGPLGAGLAGSIAVAALGGLLMIVVLRLVKPR